MHGVLVVAIIFGAAVTVLALICGTILLSIKLKGNGFSGGDRKFREEEAMMIQEIYRGLSRMEDRIETLETIIMERQGRKEQER